MGRDDVGVVEHIVDEKVAHIPAGGCPTGVYAVQVQDATRGGEYRAFLVWPATVKDEALTLRAGSTIEDHGVEGRRTGRNSMI
jgi:hypothetical protein